MSLTFTAPTSGTYEIRVQGPSPVEVQLNGKSVMRSQGSGGSHEALSMMLQVSQGDVVSGICGPGQPPMGYFRRLSGLMTDWMILGDHPPGLEPEPLTLTQKVNFIKDAFGLSDDDIRGLLNG